MAALPDFDTIWEEKHDEMNSQIDSDRILNSPPISNTLHFKRKGGIFFGPRDGLQGDIFIDSNYGTKSEFSCCNQTFSTAEQLARHKTEHVNCSFLDCDFKAHDKLVEFHEIHQHRNGLYSKIAETDLTKWRQERKKNFPTLNKITRVKEMKDAKIARGEVIEERNFGKMGKNRFDTRNSQRNNSRGRPQERPRFNRNENRTRRMNHHQNNEPRAFSWHARREVRKVGLAYEHPEEDPLSCFVIGREDAVDVTEEAKEIDDSPILETDLHKNTIEKSSLSLLAAYDDSASDSDAEPPNETSTIYGSAESEIPSQDSNTERKSSSIESKSVKCPAAKTKEDIILENNSFRGNKLPTHPVVRLQKRRQTFLTNSRMYLKRPRLLEMLLAGEIRHERNVVMQCVRHICNENFFGIENKEVHNNNNKRKSNPASRATVNSRDYDCDETWDEDV